MFLDNCTFRIFDQEILDACYPFDCGHQDLNDFFINDSVLYARDLIGKSYCFTLDDDPKSIVCAFSISNDSIKVSNLPNARKQKVNKLIARAKHFRSYPAVLIGRLGVNRHFRGQKIGLELMDFIKAWFIDGANKTGCRFIVVDSYNEQVALKYYVECGFTFLFSSEDQEKEYLGRPLSQHLDNRLMYFDLIILRS